MSRAQSSQDPRGAQVTASRSFDDHFRELVIPRLRAALELGAVLVNAEIETFMEASARVHRMAHQRGAGRLSVAAQDRLADWIDFGLLKALDAPVRDGLVTPARLAEITGEPRQC